MPNAVQVTAPVRDALSNHYEFEARGAIEVKGKGAMDVFLLKGHKHLAPQGA